MAKIIWDDPLNKTYETGVDHGVLYTNGNTLPWNGLTNVEEKETGPVTPLYRDGVPYYNKQSFSGFSGTIYALTYPEEFERFIGSEYGAINPTNIHAETSSLFNRNEPFSIAYRTKIGNSTEGDDFGYKIHVIYGIRVVPQDKEYQTESPDMSLTEFSWDFVTSVANDMYALPNYRPTAHVIFDSTRLYPPLLKDLEEFLFGTEDIWGHAFRISDLIDFVLSWALITIVDNGDGAWTATGPDEFIYAVDDTTYTIDNANISIIDSVSYVISNTSEV